MDIKHYCIEKGNGDALVLLHGNGGSSDEFDLHINSFAEKFHVYAIDTRGHGKTPRGDDPFTIRQFADDLRDFMDEHNIGKANIFGFSDGGNIAMVFAINYPERVIKLILNGANLDCDGIKIRFRRMVEAEYQKACSDAGNSSKVLADVEMLGLMVNDPNVLPEQLESIAAPTLVLAGENDLIKKRHTKLIADRIPNSMLVFLKGTHFIIKENPDAYNKTVMDFLTE